MTEAEVRASDGVAKRHHADFRIFRKPAVPRPLANHVLQPVFSTTASWDPVSDFLEDHVPCSNYTVEEEVYIGRQRCLRCKCKCGEGIRAFDLGITQVNDFLPRPTAEGLPKGARKDKILAEGATWQEVATAAFPRLPINLEESTGTLLEGGDAGTDYALPTDDRRIHVVLTHGDSVKFGAVGAFAPAEGKLQIPVDHKAWIFQFALEQGDPLAGFLHCLSGGFRESLSEAQEADTEFGPLRIAVKRLATGATEAETELALARKFGVEVARTAMSEATRCLIDELGLLTRVHEGNPLICIPAGGKVQFGGEKVNFRKYFLKLAHEDVVGVSHAGPTQTYRHLIERGVWWGSMWNQTQSHCKACLPCAIATARAQADIPRGAERHLGIFRVLHVDHVGPLRTSNGYRYILTIRDHATLWTWFIPVQSKKTAEAAKAILAHAACLVGFPVLIRTDQGFGEVGDQSLGVHLRAYGILHAPTMPYNPTGNTVAESVHKPLRRFLEKFCCRADWPEFLPYISWSTRTMVFDALGGRSPYELVFGRKPRHAFEHELRTAFGGSPDVERYIVDAEKFQSDMNEAMKLSKHENHRNRTKVAAPPKLAAGDLCVVQNKKKTKKEMEPRNWPALFKVKSMHPRGVTLTDLHGKDATGKASGMLPRHMVAKVADGCQAEEMLGCLDPAEIPTTEQMLGPMRGPFARTAREGQEDEE